jgi:hypothetical protein
MEVIVNKYHMDDEGYAVFEEMEFSALCILGKDSDPNKNVEPCFEGAKVTNYTLDKEQFKLDFANMVKELKESFKNQSSENEVDNIKYTSEEGGKQVLNEKLELITKYNLTLEQLDFSIDDISIEDLELKLKEFTLNLDTNSAEISFSTTYRQKREALQNALDPKTEKDDNDNIIYEEYLWVEDFDDEFVFVEKSIWTPDNYERKYGRFSYTFNDETITATITGEFEEMVLVWLTLEENQKLQEDRASASNYAVLKHDFEEYKNNYSTINSEVERLKEFEKITIASERKEAEINLFSQFEVLNGIDEFEVLKTKASEYSMDELQEKCYAILGKKNANFSFKSSTKKEKVKIEFSKSEEKTDGEYDELFNKYLKRD